MIISASAAIALGTYLGGWRIIRTMGKGITDIESPQGFSAETSAAAVIMTSSQLGFALSTTHVCSGGVIGAGVAKRLAAGSVSSPACYLASRRDPVGTHNVNEVPTHATA